MNKKDFYFDLPLELIAQYPLKNRTDSRLLHYNSKTQTTAHQHFRDLVDFLEPGDLLVMNNSKVIPARLFGNKLSGGRVELLVERILDDNIFHAHIKSSKSPKPGAIIQLDKEYRLEVLGREKDLFICQSSQDVFELLTDIGHIPLPPYITRADEDLDKQRYQTVYAQHKGSVAAPTAGLHFDDTILAALKAKGIHIAYLTLHVGAGTFRPVRCDNIKDHTMHFERFTLTKELCDAVENTQRQGKRIIAVGTTALRSLESAALLGKLKPCSKDTDIFIYPGFEFKICNGLITNFHLPESTLVMLVSAFIGYEKTMALYKEAIEEKYRFFSYGDASLLL